MDQEDSSASEKHTKSLTRSTARHIRRKRLKDALKAEKERTLLVNGDKEIIAKEKENSRKNDKSTDTLSKSKARRLRRKNKKHLAVETSPIKSNSPTDCTQVHFSEIVNNTQEKLVNNETQEENEDSTAFPQTIQHENEDSSTKEIHKDPVFAEDEKCKLPQWPTIGTESEERISKDGGIETTAGEKISQEIVQSSPSSATKTANSTSENTKPIEEIKELETRTSSNMVGGKENSAVKTKAEIKAEREARRVAKVAAKAKGVKSESTQESSISPATTPNEVISADKKATENEKHTMSPLTGIPDKTSVEEDQVLDSKISENKSSKGDVKAEREARRAAKAAAKAKAKEVKVGDATNLSTSKTTSTPQKTSSTDPLIKDASNITSTVETSDKPSAKREQVADAKSNEEKSKAELRAERRAKQEAQRAAKQQKQQVQGSSQQKKVQKPSKPEETNVSPALEDRTKKVVARKVITPNQEAHEVNLFKHLYHERDLALVDTPSLNSKIHPAIVRLGVQYASKVIVGSNARCIALLAAVKQLLRDFERPSQADFIRGLEANLQESAAYLHHCRPSAVSMQNALRHLKWQMTQLPSTLSDMDAKSKLQSSIDKYIEEQIELAGKMISITIQKKISNGDIILTYGYSSLINKILLDAHGAGTKFRVIVVDGRPWLEGREQLRRLAKHGVECSYILINALSYVMPEVSKVFLGAHAILANGAVMSRAGTAQVALIARAFNVPVLVACETHKSCERVQTDSIVYNELGNPDELANQISHGHTTKKSVLTNWRTRKSLNLLNITYDVTPADLVTAVVTELAILPCTSVPVILRIKPSEI